MTSLLRFAPLVLVTACAHPPTGPVAEPRKAISSEPTVQSAVRSEDLQTLQLQIDRLAQSHSNMAVSQANLAVNFALFSCNPDLKVVLTKLRSECDARLTKSAVRKPVRLASTVPMTTKGANRQAPRPVDELTPCPTAYVRPRLLDLEESLGISVAKLLQDLPHEVIYFEDNVGRMGRDREQRLQELISVPFLAGSKLLLVTPADRSDSEADLRIEWVLQWLLHQGVLASKIDRPLKYRLNISTGELRPHDQPELLEPRDLGRAIFIFRLGC